MLRCSFSYTIVVVTMLGSLSTEICLGSLQSTCVALLLAAAAAAGRARHLFFHYALCASCHVDQQVFVAFRSWNVACKVCVCVSVKVQSN